MRFEGGELVGGRGEVEGLRGEEIVEGLEGGQGRGVAAGAFGKVGGGRGGGGFLALFGVGGLLGIGSFPPLWRHCCYCCDGYGSGVCLRDFPMYNSRVK